MYKTITIDNKDYKLEYTVEASLYSDCASNVMELMAKLEGGEDKIAEKVRGLGDIPQTALTLFYAGLLEHHVSGDDADGSIESKADAKRLAVAWLKANGSWYDLLSMCIDKMVEDGFFELIGLDNLFQETKEEKNLPKVPQDHKKKQTKKNVATEK